MALLRVTGWLILVLLQSFAESNQRVLAIEWAVSLDAACKALGESSVRTPQARACWGAEASSVGKT